MSLMQPGGLAAVPFRQREHIIAKVSESYKKIRRRMEGEKEVWLPTEDDEVSSGDEESSQMAPEQRLESFGIHAKILKRHVRRPSSPQMIYAKYGGASLKPKNITAFRRKRSEEPIPSPGGHKYLSVYPCGRGYPYTVMEPIYAQPEYEPMYGHEKPPADVKGTFDPHVGPTAVPPLHRALSFDCMMKVDDEKKIDLLEEGREHYRYGAFSRKRISHKGHKVRLTNAYRARTRHICSDQNMRTLDRNIEAQRRYEFQSGFGFHAEKEEQYTEWLDKHCNFVTDDFAWIDKTLEEMTVVERKTFYVMARLHYRLTGGMKARLFSLCFNYNGDVDGDWFINKLAKLGILIIGPDDEPISNLYGPAHKPKEQDPPPKYIVRNGKVLSGSRKIHDSRWKHVRVEGEEPGVSGSDEDDEDASTDADSPKAESSNGKDKDGAQKMPLGGAAAALLTGGASAAQAKLISDALAAVQAEEEAAAGTITVDRKNYTLNPSMFRQFLIHVGENFSGQIKYETVQKLLLKLRVKKKKEVEEYLAAEAAHLREKRLNVGVVNDYASVREFAAHRWMKDPQTVRFDANMSAIPPIQTDAEGYEVDRLLPEKKEQM